MQQELSIALETVSARLPVLAQALVGRRLVQGDGMPFTAFNIVDAETLVYDIPAETSQDEITFALGVTAFMLANDVQERGRGRDIVLWSIAANTCGQMAVAKVIDAPEKAADHLARFNRRFPGVDPDQPLEALYSAMLRLKGGKPARLN